MKATLTVCHNQDMYLIFYQKGPILLPYIPPIAYLEIWPKGTCVVPKGTSLDPTHKLPSSFSGFIPKRMTYWALASKLCSRYIRCVHWSLRSSSISVKQKSRLTWNQQYSETKQKPLEKLYSDLYLNALSIIWGPPYTGGSGQTATGVMNDLIVCEVVCFH